MFKHLEALQSVIWVTTTTAGFWPGAVDPDTDRPLYGGSVFVRSVTLTAGRHVYRNGEWGKDRTVVAEGGSPVPCPVFSGTYIPNINAIGEPLLARIADIPPLLCAPHRRGVDDTVR